MNVTDELDRRIELAQEIRKRLDNGEPVSSVLSQARLSMNFAGNGVLVALIDILIHGPAHIPYQPIPFKDQAYRKAMETYMKLFSMQDVSKIDFASESWLRGMPEEHGVLAKSITEMESLKPPFGIDPVPSDSPNVVNLKLQHALFLDRAKSILSSTRALIYDKVGGLWVEDLREKERINLLGPDYRIVTQELDALETPVGHELLAAIDNLSSNNPAKWNACALVCRNVILKLSKHLWKVESQSYFTRSGKTLDLSGDKEKNRLFAYIDYLYTNAAPDKQESLEEADKLVSNIYNLGSKGKQQVRHAEAQKLVIDTFHLVSVLNDAGGLTPVEALSPTGE